MSLRDLAFYIKDTTLGVGNAFRSTVLRICLSCCMVVALVWVAVMMYVSFYYAYMPSVRHAQPVYLQFSSECSNGPDRGLCSFPEANVSLSKGERILMRGQKYQIFLDLDMPHSPVNQKLGMFMVNIKFLTHSGSVVSKSSRSCMIHYKSGLLRTISTMLMSIPLMFGFFEEKQIVAVQLFENYVDDSYHPAVGINVAIMAKHIEIYGASLRIEAQFAGLRYILFNWPITSAFIIISANFIVVSFVFFFAYTAFIPDQGEEIYRTASQETMEEVEQLTGDVRRRDLSIGEGTPQSNRRRISFNRNGRSKVKTTHKRTRTRNIRTSVSSSRLVPTLQDPPERRRLRSATFPPFRWKRAGSPGAADSHSDEAVHSTLSTIRRDSTSDAGVLLVGRAEGRSRITGDITTDRRAHRDEMVLQRDARLAVQRRALLNKNKKDSNDSRPVRPTASLTDAKCINSKTQYDEDIENNPPLKRSKSYESSASRVDRELYTIIDPKTGKCYYSYEDYKKRKVGKQETSYRIGSTDASEEEETRPSFFATREAKCICGKHATREECLRLESSRSLSNRVPDGAPASSDASASGPSMGTSEEREEFIEGNVEDDERSSSVRKRTKKARAKLSLSFRKMLSLK